MSANNQWILYSTGAIILLSLVQAQNQECVFNQNVQAGQIYSVSCPNQNSCGSQCTWVASCPAGYNCRLDCRINVPANAGCTRAQVQVSKSGDPSLRDAEWYCGQGTLTAVSLKRNIIISLVTPERVGYFTCNLVAQRAPPDESPCTCGMRNLKRIVNGKDAQSNEFPMMVGLVERGRNLITCGGTIISRRYVLSAAHCLTGKDPNNIGVIVGEQDTSKGSDSPATKAYRVSSIRTHPSYNDFNYDYDVGILKTVQEIEFSEYVNAVCLPFRFRNSDFANKKLTILGWGTTFIGGPTSDVLQKVEVDVISQETCRQVVPVTPRQLCTYTPGKDACQFDSGGPLLYTDRQTGYLFQAAIVSFGRQCASENEPGVNTRVTEILNWIVQTAPDNYCVK